MEHIQNERQPFLLNLYEPAWTRQKLANDLIAAVRELEIESAGSASRFAWLARDIQASVHSSTNAFDLSSPLFPVRRFLLRASS